MNEENDERIARRKEIFGGALFDIEHALSMYATSYCTVPASAIYEKEALDPYMSVVENCHIYLIGFTPVVKLLDAKQVNNNFHLTFSVKGKECQICAELPPVLTLKSEEDIFYLETVDGDRCWPNEAVMMRKISEQTGELNFEVKYVGQAYGKDGSRNAVDRLLKHETLQKIAVKGVPDGHNLSLLLLEVQPNNQMFTVFNPFAENSDSSNARIKSGIDKLYGTTEQERIALYEASLIRYFMPEYNKEFKNSFPSTNLKILQDCYEKDFSAVISEVCIEELPFKIFSTSVAPKAFHIAKHDLHKEDNRRAFFGI